MPGEFYPCILGIFRILLLGTRIAKAKFMPGNFKTAQTVAKSADRDFFGIFGIFGTRIAVSADCEHKLTITQGTIEYD